jgi:hypothetical protein
MKIKNSNWSIFLTSILILQLMLSSFCLVDFQFQSFHSQSETTLKQLDSNAQAIEETESLVELFEENKEEVELSTFTYHLLEVLNFSSKSCFDSEENSNSRNFSFIPYSPPEKIS